MITRLLFICCILFITTRFRAQISDFDTQPFELSEPLNGTDHQRYIRMADNHLARYNLIGALEALDLAVNSGQESATAYLKRALVRQQLGMEKQAMEDFNKANRINPYIADLMGFNGKTGTLSLLAFEPQSYMLDIDWQKRKAYYQDLLKNDKAVASMTMEEREMTQKVLTALDENSSNIYTSIDSMLQKYPESYLANDLAGVYYMKQEQWKKAEKHLLKSVRLNDSFAIGWYNLGLLEQQQGHMAEAIRHFDKAILLQNDLSKAYFNKALAYKNLGDRQKAIEEYDKVLSMKDQNHLEALVNRALTKKMMGDFNGALADIEKAIEMDPSNPDLYKNRGNLYLLFDHIPYAIMDYTQAIELSENYAEVYYNRGLAYLKYNRPFLGCKDIAYSASLGYELAQQRESFFCRN